MAVLRHVLGLALGSVQPMIMSTLHHLTPTDRHGEAIALRSMTINLSSTVMPLVFGVAGAALGRRGAVLGDGRGRRRRQLQAGAAGVRIAPVEKPDAAPGLRRRRERFGRPGAARAPPRPRPRPASRAPPAVCAAGYW